MGKASGLPSRLSSEDEAQFPKLSVIGYRVASAKDTSHNCVAYAADDKARKWDPSPIPNPGYYWPPGARRDQHPDALKSAFEQIGYELCVGGEFEDDYEKVALYVDSNGYWSHAAKQEENGEWSCKLGDEEDIRHKTPHCFSGSIYGEVVYFMKRPRRVEQRPMPSGATGH
jgi:hypothetical protein